MKDYRDVIIRPIVTEKSMKLMAEDNKYTFEVAKGTNKIEIRQAVEAIWNVKVEKVNTSNSRQLEKMTHLEPFAYPEPHFVLFDYRHRNPLNYEAKAQDIYL